MFTDARKKTGNGLAAACQLLTVKSTDMFCIAFSWEPRDLHVGPCSNHLRNRGLAEDGDTCILRLKIFFCLLRPALKHACTVKIIRRFYGKTSGIWLPVLLPLFLWAFTYRTFLEIKIW